MLQSRVRHRRERIATQIHEDVLAHLRTELTRFGLWLDAVDPGARSIARVISGALGRVDSAALEG